jgi:hypothetical protein
MFNVSPKTIRDIWNRRTWATETRHLWKDGETQGIRKKYPKVKSVDNGGKLDDVMSRNHFHEGVEESADESSIETKAEIPKTLQLENLHTMPKFSNNPQVPQFVMQEYTGKQIEECSINRKSTVGPETQDPFHFDWPHWQCSTSPGKK